MWHSTNQLMAVGEQPILHHNTCEMHRQHCILNPKLDPYTLYLQECILLFASMDTVTRPSSVNKQSEHSMGLGMT